MTVGRRVALLLILVILGVVAIYLVPDKTSLVRTLEPLLTGWLTKDWVQFDIPSPPLALRGDVSISSDSIQICNRTAARWKDVVIRITNSVPVGELPPFDNHPFAKTGDILPGACADTPKRVFASAGWKRIPAPSQMNIVRVEVLARVEGVGYLDKDLTQ